MNRFRCELCLLADRTPQECEVASANQAVVNEVEDTLFKANPIGFR